MLMLNSYCYLSVDKMFSLFFNLFKRRKENNKEYYEKTVGAYGGLFMHKDILNKCLPDEKLFVYFDDIDFTFRLRKQGARIFLVKDSKITDLDRTLANPDVKSYFSILRILENIHSMNKQKLHYGYRNRIILERRHLITNKFKYSFNRFIFSCVLFPLCCMLYFCIYGNIKNPRLIKQAIREGLEFEEKYRK